MASLEAGRGADAVELFMTAAGLPHDAVSAMWTDPRLLAMAHTMRYDIEVMGEIVTGRTLPEDEVRAIAVPTLVLAGGASPAFFRDTAARIAGILRDGRLQIVPGEGHEPTPEVVAAAVREFLASGGTEPRPHALRFVAARCPRRDPAATQ